MQVFNSRYKFPSGAPQACLRCLAVRRSIRVSVNAISESVTQELTDRGLVKAKRVPSHQAVNVSGLIASGI